MSTNATIAIKQPDGSYRAIYLHSDGYPTHAGLMLVRHYSTAERATALIALGDISVIAEELTPKPGAPHYVRREAGEWARQPGVTLAYGRDFGDKGTEAYDYETDAALREGADGMGASYLYVFDNGWKVAQGHGFTYGPYVELTEGVCQLDEVYAEAD